MSSAVKERGGFSSQPVHMQVPRYQEQPQLSGANEYDNSPYQSDPDESLCCCPSLSELLVSCSKCCPCFCCCRKSDRKSEKYANVNYRYLPPEKGQDSIDGVVLHGDSHSLSYKLYQFPQDPQQFPTHHPSLPLFKPNRIELRQPQMKFTPGAGTRPVMLPQTESPFPAPYLQDRGPGMQTPFAEVPIRHQPRAYPNMGGVGSIQLATATAQRKKRTSRTKGKVPRQESLTKPTTTVTDIDVGTTTKVGGIESETKVPIEEEDEEEEEMMKLRLAQGRQLSLPLEGSTARGRKRLFSMAAKRIGGYEGVLDSAEKEAEEREKEKRRKHRLIHRARTVGSSPSQKPTINPEKYRRCQTPEFSVEGDKAEVRKGLALRKCKTPEVIMMRRETKREGEGEKRQQSDSPNTSSSPSPAKSGGAPEGETDGKAKVGGGGEGGGTEGTETAATAATQGDSLATKLISTDATASTKRKWGSRREKSRKDPGSPLEAPKKAKVPPHISASASSYLVSGSVATAPRGGESASAGLENPPYIYFSLYFDIQRRALTVNLIKVENLPPKPPNQGSCDPFVMMFLLPNKQEVLQSVIKQGTLNPEFQQVFEFGGILANDLKNQVLVFRVFDHDRFSKNDLIGTVIMPLKDADLYGVLMRRPVDQRKGLLKQFSAGDLLFSLTYSEERQVINGIILKATNLRKADIWGLADPYVKIYMIHDSKRTNKWKTEVKKNTLVPIYNESFQFDVSGLDIRNVSLEIWVMDYDWFSRNDKMGVVYVGANSPQEVGRSHWLEIVSAPEHQTSHWHTIIPYTDLKQVLGKQQQRQQQRVQLQQQQQQIDYLRPPATGAQHRPQLPGNSLLHRGDSEPLSHGADSSTL